jgi:hypothetical protein
MVTIQLSTEKVPPCPIENDLTIFISLHDFRLFPIHMSTFTHIHSHDLKIGFLAIEKISFFCVTRIKEIY